MTNHFISFPLKKKKKKEEKKLHRGHKDEDSFPVSKAFHASTPSAKRHKSPKEEEETSCLPSIRKIWNPKVERSSSSSSSSAFRGKSCHGGGGRRTHADEQRAVRGRYTCVNAVWRTTEHCISAGNFATMHRTWITGGR